MSTVRNSARHQNPILARVRPPRMDRPRTSLVNRPRARQRPPPAARVCRNGSRRCIYMCRDTNKQCLLCTHNQSGYCWQHSLNPTMKMSDGQDQVVGNRQAGAELLAGDIAPIERNVDVLNDEVFISLCLRKIKDQCRHIQLPFFTDPHRVRVDASKFDPRRTDWLPFVCYVRRPHNDSQIHLVMSNFFSMTGTGVKIMVWSPQFAVLDCRNPKDFRTEEQRTRDDAYYTERLRVLAEELDVGIDDNFTQIFNCQLGNEEEYNFTPIVPIYTINKAEWNEQPQAPFNIHSVYALQCIAMVKHIVLEIQKFQRFRKSGRFHDAPMPPATDLVPIVFTNFGFFLNQLGFELNEHGRYEFDDELLRESRYTYNGARQERKSYRITISEANINDLFDYVVAPPNNNRITSEYLANAIEWTQSITDFFRMSVKRRRVVGGQRNFRSTSALIKTWRLVCLTLNHIIAHISNSLFNTGLENINRGLLGLDDSLINQIDMANNLLLQSISSRKDTVRGIRKRDNALAKLAKFAQMQRSKRSIQLRLNKSQSKLRDKTRARIQKNQEKRIRNSSRNSSQNSSRDDSEDTQALNFLDLNTIFPYSVNSSNYGPAQTSASANQEAVTSANQEAVTNANQDVYYNPYSNQDLMFAETSFDFL